MKEEEVVWIDRFVLIHKGFDYSKTEIAENTGVGYKTLFDNRDKIEQYGLVKETRTIEGATLYTINLDSPIVKALKKLQHKILFYDAEIVAQEQAEAEREVILEMKKEKAEV